MRSDVYVIFSIIVAWGIIELLIGNWMFKAKPARSIIEQYPKKIIITASLPFGGSWKKKIERNHIGVFEAYQFRVKICFLSIIVSLLAFYAYISIRF
jgi:hypothetical protein